MAYSTIAALGETAASLFAVVSTTAGGGAFTYLNNLKFKHILLKQNYVRIET